MRGSGPAKTVEVVTKHAVGVVMPGAMAAESLPLDARFESWPSLEERDSRTMPKGRTAGLLMTLVSLAEGASDLVELQETCSATLAGTLCGTQRRSGAQLLTGSLELQARP